MSIEKFKVNDVEWIGCSHSVDGTSICISCYNFAVSVSAKSIRDRLIDLIADINEGLGPDK